MEALIERRQEAERRDNLRIGRIAAAIYNANPFRGEGSEPVSELDFLPGEPGEEQPPKEQTRVLDALLSSQNLKSKIKHG